MTEERRLVTVLFADVIGSTAMGEELDPEDVRALMGRYYSVASEVVEEHGGTLEKFIGDAVMAVFGLPLAHDDDAARAAATALTLRERVREHPALGDRLPIRIGLATGEVVASVDREGTDFLVTGDAVNVAARLQQRAGSWDIVCTDRTARAVGEGFAFGPVVEVEAKGKSAPLRIRLLEGRRQVQAGPRMPFLGRDDDVAQLELTGSRAFREQRPYLVTITAPAGTGKSRLLEEFLERLTDLQPTARVLTAQCLPYGQRLTYWPLHSLILQLLGLDETADVDTLRGAVQEWLAAAGDPTAERTADLVAATFGVGEGEPVDRVELFVAWRTIIELASQQRPLVLVVEDLHWSSDSLLDLIEVVLQPRGDTPLLLVVLARPELLDRRPSWGGGRRNYVSLALEPLGELDISALTDHLLHGPPATVIATVVARAEGNPFYAGELARAIAERAGDLSDSEAVQSAVASLPDTVHGTVLARLDVLPPDPRRVLQLGSIFGRSFTPAGVAALELDMAPRVGDAVDHLLERDLLRTFGGSELTFRHILIREVAYQTLPRVERARLHGHAGSWLESIAAGREEELAELIAYHFREAINLATAAGVDVDPNVVARAVGWLRRAAQAARAGAAFEESARHIRAAIEIAASDDLPDLWAELGDTFGGGAGAVQAFATAARLGSEQGRDANFLLRAYAGQLMVQGRWQGSVGAEFSAEDMTELLEHNRAVRAAATDRRLIGHSLVAEGFLPFSSITGGVTYEESDLEAARQPAEEAAAIARELDDPELLSAALDLLGALTLGYDPVTGVRLARERESIEHRLSLAERVDLHNMLAWHSAALGDLETVVGSVEKILGDIAPNQALNLALSLSGWLVWGLAMTGRWDEVAPAVAKASRRWEDAGRPSSGFALHGFLAALEVGWARGDDALISQCQTLISGISEQFPPGNIFRRLGAWLKPDVGAIATQAVADWRPYTGRLHLVERSLSLCVDFRYQIPRETLQTLLAWVEPHDQRLLAAQVRRALGVLHGDAEALGVALAYYRAIGARPLVARTEFELGTLTVQDDLRDAGVASLEALGDLGYLRRRATLRS